MHVIVLGTAAGGGVPQWNCGCKNCNAARADTRLQRMQASLAVSADGANWFLINASPDIRQQINSTPALHPRSGKLRDTPIVGVILTNGEIDAIAGLLSLREGTAFWIYAHSRVLDTLAASSIFNVLAPDKVTRVSIEPGAAFKPMLPEVRESGLIVTPFAVPGKAALYNEGGGGESDTLGLRITDTSGHSIAVITACAEITPDLKHQIADVDALFFDGTLWRDDELIDAGLSARTGQRMGHVSMTGKNGAIAMLRDANAKKKIFIHVNNSNPALDQMSSQRAELETGGWMLPHDGMELKL